MENKSIYTRLDLVKKQLGKISKDSTNPFFKSKYFDINQLLEHVEPLLQSNGLLCLQPILDGKVTTVIMDTESKEQVTSEIQLPDLSDPQKLGSCITYYRRYTLCSLLALQAEDDDGNRVNKKITLPELNPNHEKWGAAKLSIENGNTDVIQIRKKYILTKENEKILCSK